MKKFVILSALFLSITIPSLAQTDDPDAACEATSPWSGGVEMAATNKYLWRGMTVNEGFILQPFAWLTYGNFTFSLWSSATLSEPKDDIKRPEVDATLSHEFELGNFTVESFFSFYRYIDQPDASNTGELGFTLGYPFGVLTLNAGAIVDVIEYPGALYLEQKIEAEKEFNDHWTGYSALTLGEGFKKFNDAYFEMPRTTVSLLTFEGRLTYALDNGFYAQPYFQLNQTLDNDLKAYLKKHTGAIGLTIGREF
jgi:hypothetical protein